MSWEYVNLRRLIDKEVSSGWGNDSEEVISDIEFSFHLKRQNCDRFITDNHCTMINHCKVTNRLQILLIKAIDGLFLNQHLPPVSNQSVDGTLWHNVSAA